LCDFRNGTILGLFLGERVSSFALCERFFVSTSFIIGTVRSAADLTALLTQLLSSVTQATADGTLPKKTGNDAKATLEKAVMEVEASKPEKKHLLDYLTTTKSLIEGVAAAGGLIPSIVTAIEAVHKVF
jgi:hypothetical protein